MAAVREMCAAGGDAPVCSPEDSKQAEEVEHGGEDSGDVNMEEAVRGSLSLRPCSVPGVEVCTFTGQNTEGHM